MVIIKGMYMTFFLLVVMFGNVFAFTNSYADWYGIGLFEPSPGANHFAEFCDNNIGFFRSLLGQYMFEYNINTRQPSILTSGFIFYNTIMSLIPSDFKYIVIGLDYNLLVKLFGIKFGNSNSEVILGAGGSIGLNLESVELLVGSSNFSSDFTNVDFKHFNEVHFLNILGALRAYVEVPLASYNFPSIMYMFSYNAGITLFGPFLPNLESISTQKDFQKTFSTIAHSILLRFRF